MIYGKLNAGRHDIRLLRFRAPLDSESRTINCSLEVVSLADESLPVYIALSYFWGPEPTSSRPLFEVYIDGTLFPVTDNLMVALIYLNRRCGEQIPLWIDAICINQANAVERGQQVTLMRRIYTKAFHVWAWQIPIKECDLGMDLIAEAGKHVVNHQATRSWPALSKTWLVSLLRDPQMESTWNSLVTVLQQPYWRRNWIVQELFVGSNLTIICGTKMARLSLLFGIIFGLLEITFDGEFQTSTSLGEIQVNALHVFRIALLISNGSDTLSGLLKRFDNSVATDPRDKIYSLVGIAEPYSNNILPIDYTVEWPEVFVRATRYVIEGDGNLNILASSASGSPELPSWVPNFARQSVYNLSAEHNEATPNTVILPTAPYSAGGRVLPMAHFSNDGTGLIVKVILVHPLSYILPRRADLEPIEELTRRLRFLITDYVLSTNRRVDVPESFSLEICAYVCLRFYEATFHTMHPLGIIEQVWPATDFVNFGMKCLPGNGLPSDCTEAQLDLLRTVLSPARSLFFCELKAPFSLEEDFSTARANIANIDPGVLPALRHCKFKVPGYCRNQQDWGQNGDIVSVVLGCHVPLLLRPVSAPGEVPLVMRVISEAYVYGIMNGEALGKLPVTTLP